MPLDYSYVTEVPGGNASYEQIRRLFTRYHFASQYCQGKDVLEVACGAGQGLGYLAREARKVIGGDYTDNLLRYARSHYRDRIPLCRLDAQALPFANGTFDVVILYEAIYYLEHPEKFAGECRRVLRPNGMLLMCNPNKTVPDFNPSPYSFMYFSPPDFVALLRPFGFTVTLYGDSPVDRSSCKQKLLSRLKKTAVRLNLMPKTMKGKEYLKRIFFGKLVRLPPEIKQGVVEYVAPMPISSDTYDFTHKVIYAAARVL